MVKRAINYISREASGMHQAAYMIAFFTFAAQILGFVRDRLLASTFGAGEILDTYYIAFRIPDLIFAALSMFTVGVVLIPFFVKVRKESTNEYMKLIHSNFTALCLGASMLIVVAWFAMPYLLNTFFHPQYTGSYGDELLMMSRIILFSPFLMTLSGLFGSIAQSEKRFFVYALSPIAYNIGIIAGLLFLYPEFGMVGLAYGVVVGALLHAGIQIPTLLQIRSVPRFRWFFWRNRNFIETIFIALPRSVGQFFTQLSQVVAVAVAGRIVVGAVSVFSISQIIYTVPLALISTSYNTASFPMLSELHANKQKTEFLARLSQAARHILFWTIPIAILFVVLRAQIVRTIYGSGNFGWEETRLVAATVAILISTLPINSLVGLFAQTLYIINKARLAIITAIATAILTMVLMPTYVWAFKTLPFFQNFFEVLLKIEGLNGAAVIAIPCAIITAQIVTFVFYYNVISRNFGVFMHQLREVFLHVFGAACIMGYATYASLQVFAKLLNTNTGIGIFLQGFISGIIGIIVHVVVLILLKNGEAKAVWKTIHSKIWKADRPIVDPAAQQEL